MFTCGAPCRIRTCDVLIRSQALYPAEVRAREPLAGLAYPATGSAQCQTHDGQVRYVNWRRVRDSNPRWGFITPYSLSRRAPSAYSANSPRHTSAGQASVRETIWYPRRLHPTSGGLGFRGGGRTQLDRRLGCSGGEPAARRIEPPPAADHPPFALRTDPYACMSVAYAPIRTPCGAYTGTYVHARGACPVARIGSGHGMGRRIGT